MLEKIPEPACWSWPVPDNPGASLLPAYLRPDHVWAPGEVPLDPETIEMIGYGLTDPDNLGAEMVTQWQRDRCAVCGRIQGTLLVMDHDHETGLIRGQLCRSCNTLEGLNQGAHCGVWQRYRERNPAVMLGVRARYLNPRTGEYAEPRPRAELDRVHDNPLKGIGL